MKKIDVVKEMMQMLNDAGVADAKLSCDHIIAKALEIKVDNLATIDSITDEQYEDIIKDIALRCNHVPLDKIIGFTEFLGVNIPYNKNVLTPRVETELLAEIIVKDIKVVQKAGKYTRPLALLDLCCGSGCLGISIATHTNINATLSDISSTAIGIAKTNCKTNNEARLEAGLSPINPNFIISDLFEDIPYTFDYIVCNPPYVKTADLQGLEIEVKDFDPKLALDGGKDGLDFYKSIIKSAPEHLDTACGVGKIYFEVGVDQAEKVAKMLEKNFEDIQIKKDYSGIDRFVIARKREKNVK